MRYLIFILTIVIGVGTQAQIPTQYYFANDSCEFYLPDYSQAVIVQDNCCVDSFAFYQTPHSGTRLIPGNDVMVTLLGADCAGNTTSMSFDVVVIDSIPPTFYYDSSQFIPTGQYQNEERIFKLYTTLDTTNNPDLPEMKHYYKDPDSPQPIHTNIRDDRFEVSYLDHPDDYRAQVFTAVANYRLSHVKLKIGRIGLMQGIDLVVELREMGSDGNPTGPVLSRGYKSMVDVFTMSSEIELEGAWYKIPMRPTTIYQYQSYAIIARITAGDSENKLYWRTNEQGFEGGYEIWTNNGAEETGNWQRNYNVDRLFEIWGRKI